jgi:hypothetical protein
MTDRPSGSKANDEDALVETLRSLHPSPEQEKIIAEVEAQKASTERTEQ